MASTTNFAAILDRTTNSIERPRPLPVGSYLSVVQGQPRYDESTKQKTPFVEFDFRILEALDDVDEDLLREALTVGDTVSKLGEKSIKSPFYLTETSLYRLKDFLKHCGIETEGRKLGECIEEVINSQVIIKLRHEPRQNDPETVDARIASTAPAQD